MPGLKKRQLATFNIDPEAWQQFQELCRSKDRTASSVLRNYVDLIVSKKFVIVEPPSITVRASTRDDEPEP